jgi:hypothetical protein
LLPAVEGVFPEANHGLCQTHYPKNIPEPGASADEAMKVRLRKTVRRQAGEIIRPEHVEQPGVLTVTGLIPSPVDKEQPSIRQAELNQPESVEQEKESIVDALIRRVRYLLTLKGRPPFRMAGIEMFEGLKEIAECLQSFIDYIPDDRLVRLQQSLSEALSSVSQDYRELREVANWLAHISELLDPDGKPARTGDEVRKELFAYLDHLLELTQNNPTLARFVTQIHKTTCNYDSGLFHTYDVPALPRTNNDRESEFRRLKQRLFSTTGQKGATRRLIHRSGAWELIPRPGSFPETVVALSHADIDDFCEERERVRCHRGRLKLHTRSVKQTRRQLEKPRQRWFQLPQDHFKG